MIALCQVSRPRFWIYLLGPFLLGTAAAFQTGTGAFSVAALALGLYFTLPANLLIYGVNDIFDFDTDVVNDKKKGYERVVLRTQHRTLWRAIVISNIIFIPLLFTLNLYTILACAGFIFLGCLYSAPPIRAKARPFLDSAFNALYVMPGLAAYFAFGGVNPELFLVMAGILWSAAMHAYSAVPDINADQAAGIATIATTLGAKNTLLFCLLLYVISGIIAGLTVGTIGWIGLCVYATLMLISLRSATHQALMTVYRRFPIINTALGGLLFISIVL
jgi:4-hydroxybenzoate polyprenyltransferase